MLRKCVSAGVDKKPLLHSNTFVLLCDVWCTVILGTSSRAGVGVALVSLC